MKFLIDIGNTAIVVAGYLNGIIFKEIEYTSFCKTKECFIKFLNKIINKNKIVAKDVDYIIVSSVVKEIDIYLKDVLVSSFPNCKFYRVKDINNDLKIEIDDVTTLGDDLICDLIASKEIYKDSYIVCDCGTVTKLLVVEKDGFFRNCSFFLGIPLQFKALNINASLLPEVEINNKISIYGHNTNSALTAGVFYSHIHGIKGLIKEYEQEFGYKFKLILTGGNAPLIKDYLKIKYVYDDSLVLTGLIQLLNKVTK